MGYSWLQGVTIGYRGDRGLLEVRGDYKRLQWVTRGYRRLQGCRGGYTFLQGVTRGYRGL